MSHNDKIGGDPSLVNSGAENDGWLVKIKFEDDKALSNLLITYYL